MANFNNQFATQKLRQEMSVTSTGAGMTPSTVNNPVTQDWYTTKNKKKAKKEVKDVEPKLAAGKAKVYMKNKWGWKDAPSIPNRPSEGGFIYSQIFEELSNFLKTNSQELARVEGLLAKARETKNYSVMTAYENRIAVLEKLVNDIEPVLGKQPLLQFSKNAGDYLKSIGYKGKIIQNPTGGIKNLKDIVNSIIKNETINEAVDRVHIGTDTKTDSNIYFEPSTGTFSINVIDGLGNRWNKLQVNTIDDVIAKFPAWSWTEKGIEMFPEFEPEEQDDDEDKFNWYTGDYELNESYSKFKTETKTRGKSDQFHQAVREVRKKVQEINKLFEYVSRLKSELSEGEGGLKYRIHTEKALAKIKEMVSELNQNIKRFK